MFIWGFRLLTRSMASRQGPLNRTIAQQKGSRLNDFDAHSPMFRNRNFSEERRSRLFDDKPFIHGRFPKLLLAWMFCMNFWAGYYVYHRH